MKKVKCVICKENWVYLNYKKRTPTCSPSCRTHYVNNNKNKMKFTNRIFLRRKKKGYIEDYLFIDGRHYNLNLIKVNEVAKG